VKTGDAALGIIYAAIQVATLTALNSTNFGTVRLHVSIKLMGRNARGSPVLGCV